MKKYVALGVLVLAVLALASGQTNRSYDVNATANRTINISYDVTDQQAYGLAKAWITFRGGDYVIRTDDSVGGVLAATGRLRRVQSADFYDWTCRIFIANGIAKMDFSVSTLPYDSFSATSRAEA